VLTTGTDAVAIYVVPIGTPTSTTATTKLNNRKKHRYNNENW